MATCPSCRKRYPDEARTCEVDGAELLPDQAFIGAEKDLEAGQKIGEYVVEAKIGEGGFGSVYRAVHPLIGKRAAVKVLNRQYSSNPQMVSRFIAEARAVNQIKNRFIIDIFSFGALEDGRQYYVMELLDGMPMDAYVKQRGRLTPEDALPILRGIAKALDAAHTNGVAHRDLKPENVFIVIEEDGTTFPKLLDFGIAKLLGESAAQHKTRTGTPMGTPSYMSPEQCRGKNIGHLTDVYSLGILAHEALTGRLPFDGDDVMEVLVKQTNAAPPRMSAACPAIPPALDEAVLHMLEKEAEKRPPSAIAAIDALAVAARGAGFAVELPQQRPGGSKTGDSAASGAVSRPRAGLTPAEIGAIASAQTVIQHPTGKTLMASESEVKPATSSRALLYGVFAVGCLVAAVAFVALFRGKTAGPDAADTHAPVAATAPLATSAPEVAKPRPSEATSVAPAASAAPAEEPKEIELTIVANAPKVEVFDGATRLGSGPGVIKIPRRDAPLKLTVKAPGFKPGEITAEGSKNEELKIELARTPGGPAKKGHGDLEF